MTRPASKSFLKALAKSSAKPAFWISTPAEKTKARGFCTGPHEGGPAPGQVGLDLKAPCCRCGKRVAVTVRGLFSHHKPGGGRG